MQLNWSILTGYDFFISYRRNDADHYAVSIEELLREADFRLKRVYSCFPNLPIIRSIRWTGQKNEVFASSQSRSNESVKG
jgi:hypothetical protein